MRKTEICAAKTNALVAGEKMNKAVAKYNSLHEQPLVDKGGIVVARVVLCPQRTGNFANPSRTPFVCFMKKLSNNKNVVVGMETGKADIVDGSILVIKHWNLDSFCIKGVQYRIKDRVNDLPRFAAMHDKKPRNNKISLNNLGD